MKLSVAASLGLALLIETAAAGDGGFFGSCKHNWSQQGKYMVAECKKTNGQYMRTRQDMNLCLGNFNGELKPANKGNFLNRCHSCTEGGPGPIVFGAPPSSWLTCVCVRNDGSEHVAQINLNNVVSNQNGYMWCSGHRSAPY